jgi:hypothetical protein
LEFSGQDSTSPNGTIPSSPEQRRVGYEEELKESIARGDLQQMLELISPNSQVLILTGLEDSTDREPTTSGKRLGGGTIAVVSIGAVLFPAALVLFYLGRRRKRPSEDDAGGTRRNDKPDYYEPYEKERGAKSSSKRPGDEHDDLGGNDDDDESAARIAGYAGASTPGGVNSTTVTSMANISSSISMPDDDSVNTGIYTDSGLLPTDSSLASTGTPPGTPGGRTVGSPENVVLATSTLDTTDDSIMASDSTATGGGGGSAISGAASTGTGTSLSTAQMGNLGGAVAGGGGSNAAVLAGVGAAGVGALTLGAAAANYGKRQTKAKAFEMDVGEDMLAEPEFDVAPDNASSKSSNAGSSGWSSSAGISSLNTGSIDDVSTNIDHLVTSPTGMNVVGGRASSFAPGATTVTTATSGLGGVTAASAAAVGAVGLAGLAAGSGAIMARHVGDVRDTSDDEGVGSGYVVNAFVRRVRCISLTLCRLFP